MLKIYAIPALSDNYIWVLVKNNTVVVVDPGESYPVMDFLSKFNLDLSAILVTHHHQDHTKGIDELQKNYPHLQIFTHQNHLLTHLNPAVTVVSDLDKFFIKDLEFLVYQTAGHTAHHVSFLLQDDDKIHVFCGDTLFSGGCGRVFDGTIEQLFTSIHRLNSLPSDTLFYPAHEYTQSNLQFALSVCGDKHRQIIQQTLQQVRQDLIMGKISLPTTLEKERQINVFLQTKDDELIYNLTKIYPWVNSNCSNLDIFSILRELKNNFKG